MDIYIHIYIYVHIYIILNLYAHLLPFSKRPFCWQNKSYCNDPALWQKGQSHKCSRYYKVWYYKGQRSCLTVQLLQLLQVVPDLTPDLITSVFKHQRINECFHWFGLTGHKHKRKSKLGSHFISKHCPNTKPFSRLITLHSNIKWTQRQTWPEVWSFTLWENLGKSSAKMKSCLC